MQVIPENKNERRSSRGTDLVVIILCIERISRYIEIRKEFRREDEETMLETNYTCWIIYDSIETKWKRRLS